MSGIYGTTQSYDGLAGTYLYLAPSCGDKLFATNINYCDLTNWGIYDGQENDPKVLAIYQSQRKKCTTNTCDTVDTTKYQNATSIAPGNAKTTVWSFMQRLPNLSKWCKLVKRANFESYLNSINDITYVTVFAPTDDALTDDWMTFFNNTDKGTLRTYIQVHTLPFFFDQRQATDKKLRLYTSLETFSLYVDGTGEVSNRLNLYIPKEEWLNFRYPEPLKRMNIGQAYYANNGALYLLDGVCKPNVAVN